MKMFWLYSYHSLGSALIVVSKSGADGLYKYKCIMYIDNARTTTTLGSHGNYKEVSQLSCQKLHDKTRGW